MNPDEIDLDGLDGWIVVMVMAHSIRQAARWLVVAHDAAELLDLTTRFFLETAVVLADYAHDLDQANQQAD